jgi:nucleotide-binding universal stress UspA family protein
MKDYGVKRILVPVDFSETSGTALVNAIALAKLLKAELSLICVIEHKWHHFINILEGHIVSPTLLDIEMAVAKKMNQMKERISKKFDLKAKIFVASGHVHAEVIKISEKEKIDLIVMGTHGVSEYNELFIGSTAQRVVTLSGIPVLTMQKECNKPRFKNILIPIDNSTHSREKVNIAILFGHLFGARIHILGLPDSKDKAELNKFNTKIESVEEIVSSTKLPRTTTIVHGANLAKSAISYAYKNKCDLIIINTGHESRITGIFMGAFAQQIVNHSKIPVLSIKHTSTKYRMDSPGSPDF